MARTQEFTVENASVTTLSTTIEVDGEQMAANVDRLVVEAVPVSRIGKTLSLVLPTDAVDDFAEGAKITITIDTTAPVAAAQES